MEKGAMTDWLRLNVGGTMFETSRTTLTSDPDSILSRMFEPNSNLPPATVTKGGAYLIDACPRGFEVVLNYLRYRSLVLGPGTKSSDVLPVADYFGLLRSPGSSGAAGEASGEGGRGEAQDDQLH